MAEINELKFITKENLETFAKNLFIPEIPEIPEIHEQKIKKFRLFAENKNYIVSNIIFTSRVDIYYEGTDDPYTFGDDRIMHVDWYVRSNKDCLLLQKLGKTGIYTITNWINNEEKLISTDKQTTYLDFFLLGEYETVYA